MTTMRQRDRQIRLPMTQRWTIVALCALGGTCVFSAVAFTPQNPLTAVPHAQRLADRYTTFLLSEKDMDDSSSIDEESEEFQKAVRVAKAKSEIDKILKGPDAPFDLETELVNVEGISPPSSLPPLENQVSELESELYSAIDRQDYPLAAQKKEELSKMHVDDCGAVLQVNSAFYRAFSEKDFESMEQVWLKDASVLCIHPSHAPLVGANAVLTSWKSMFDASSTSFQRTWMIPTKIRLTVKGATAILTCDEEVYCRRFVRGKKRQTERVNKLTATNVFRKIEEKWFMVHHHASWHADSEAAKMALKGGYNSEVVEPHKSLYEKRRNKRRSAADTEISPDGIIGGNFGPVLGGGGEEAPQDGGPVKSVIFGSLSGLLDGPLNDLLNRKKNGGGISQPIIEFERIDEDGDEDKKDQGGDDDQNDHEIEAVSIIKEWGKSLDGGDSASSSSNTKLESSSSSVPKDALRQNCISALRKLCNQGSISPKQKRVLLTDIITCSAKGEFSMVEVAYELLCGEGEDKDAAEEEFADQCRVFAQSLPDSPKQ